MRGAVLDDGKPVAGAKVVLAIWTYNQFEQTVTKYGTQTDAQGRFQFDIYQAQHYSKLQIEALSGAGRYHLAEFRIPSAAPIVCELTEQPMPVEERLEYARFEGSAVGRILWLNE